MAQGAGGFRPGDFFRDPRVKRVAYWLMVLGIWGLIALAAMFLVFARGLPSIDSLDDLTSEPSISYLDRSGAQIAVRGNQKTDLADIDSLPDYVPKAFIIGEDQWFYWHPGFNPWGIVRSQIYNMQHRGEGMPLRGGSTITQQVARNLFPIGRAQNLKRKIQELILAMELEVRYSKKEILGLYLNRMDFGGGARGIEAASKRYFNKSAAELDIDEAAILVAVLKGTSRYSPVANRENAQRRATAVIDQMVKEKAITPQQRDEAYSTPVRVSENPSDQRAGYFIDWINSQVLAVIGGQPTEDLIVQTTLDLPLQQAAEAALAKGVTDNERAGVRQGALISLDGEGRIRAYVGGPDYYDTEFDAVSNGLRQPGSAFKPFVYLAAMENGLNPMTPVVDEPITIGDWTPSNYDGTFAGEMTLQTALARSINTVAARLTNEVGPARVASVAHRLGITTPIPEVPSIALGAAEVRPIELAQAYAAFSNGGYKVRAYGVQSIRSAATGRVLYDYNRERTTQPQVITSPALQYMNQMMRQVLTDGTGTAANVPGYDVAGKSGTTSDYHDAWFAGYTGGFTTVVWLAGAEGRLMSRVTGGGAPARIWRAYMSQALPRLQKQDIPGGVAEIPPPGPDIIGGILSGLGLGGDQPPPPPLPSGPVAAPPATAAPKTFPPASDLPY